MNIILTGGEVLKDNTTEDFRFSMDFFQYDEKSEEKWRKVRGHFKYIGNKVGGRVWNFIGTLKELEAKAKEINLKVLETGYRSNPKWNDGNWVYVSLREII